MLHPDLWMERGETTPFSNFHSPLGEERKMIIKCAICGNDLEVDNNTVDGQHFLCPYCGEKFEYRKPTRVELPPSKPSSDAGPQNMPLPKENAG